eukprot:CAMPEP_0185024182 /NCGR_PEP_ID=MMETSP1103-20130426/7145_1 /TAXON_ID=36769 /ORGANISM="Paraphysomonas bandaiensis, Strain Caron Lab Isolate" /LENGTH=392 /DNA_ID=CAMNT_0027557079 /DNA_START=270 /DNA_END=1448 /DNA_ORIENTATION=+
MYSGYVNVTEEDWLFYWFFETADGNPDAPLIIWTNGGPGCSSMEGATTENGPLVLFDIKEACSTNDCDYTEQLSLNPYSWNAHANVLYLDQPRYVGYSFGYGEKVKSSVEAAQDFIVFYNGWLELFPEFQGRELIISGESYGGHYVPAWAGAILDYNEEQTSESDKINFSGVVIGNGCVNNTVQGMEPYVDFLHESNLIPADSNPRTMATAEVEMVRYIGYTPNYYDYRTESVSCGACYSYNYTAWAHWFLQEQVEESLNVCGDAGDDAFAGNAGGCINLPNFDANDPFDYSGALGRTLDAGVPVTLYYGKTDTACNYKGGYAMANSISWQGQEEFAAAGLGPMDIAGVEAGQAKSYKGLTWIQVESAGHMVPIDQPAASAMAIGTILSTLN